MLRLRLLPAAACAAALLAPHAALAKGGGSSSTSCEPVRALNSGAVDRPASGKRVTVDLQVANCSAATATVALRLVPTAFSLRSYDPYVVETCTGEAYGGQGATLRAGESRSLSAPASVPYCGVSPWGIDATYSVDYAVSLVDSATGAVLGTTTSTIVHQGGN